MSKKSKKERKAQREAARAAARKAERQRNMATLAVLAVVVAIGGVLVWVSLDDQPDLAELLDANEDEESDAGHDAASDEPRPVEPQPEPQPPAEPAADERPVACGAELPERAGETKPTYSSPEQVLEEGVVYEAVIETSCGSVRIELDTDNAPVGTNAFVFLATTGFYDGLEIFRHALGIDVLQTGSGSNDAAYQIGYHLPDELDTARADGYPAGSVAYANAGSGTSGSQFFLVYGDAFQQTVDGGALEAVFTRFGLVADGLEVLEEIAGIPVEGERPQEQVYMETVTILADGEPLPTEHREADAADSNDDEE